MARYQKKPTVVEAYQADAQINMGSLGALVTEDWIIKAASGTLTTLSNTSFLEKYSAASPTTSLTGDDLT